MTHKPLKEKQIRKQYLSLLPHLLNLISYVENKLATLPKDDFNYQTSIKPFDSVIRKSEVRKINDISDLSDLIRGRLFFSKNYLHDQVVDLLKNLFRDCHCQLTVESKKNLREGLLYQGIIHLDLHKNGINFELQIVPQEFAQYVELLHTVYQQNRRHNLTSHSHIKNIYNRLYQLLTQLSILNRQHLES